MGLSVAEANERLKNINTEVELRALIEELSVETHGSKTVLFARSHRSCVGMPT